MLSNRITGTFPEAEMLCQESQYTRGLSDDREQSKSHLQQFGSSIIEAQQSSRRIRSQPVQFDHTLQKSEGRCSINRPQVSAGLPTSYHHSYRPESRGWSSAPLMAWPNAMKCDSNHRSLVSPIASRVNNSPTLLSIGFTRPNSCYSSSPDQSYRHHRLQSSGTDYADDTASLDHSKILSPDGHHLQTACSSATSLSSFAEELECPSLAASDVKPAKSKALPTTTFRYQADTDSQLSLGFQFTSREVQRPRFPSLLPFAGKGNCEPSNQTHGHQIQSAKNRTSEAVEQAVPLLRLFHSDAKEDLAYFETFSSCETLCIPRPRLRIRSLSTGADKPPGRHDAIEFTGACNRHGDELSQALLSTRRTAFDIDGREGPDMRSVIEAGLASEEERQKWREQYLQSFAADCPLTQALQDRARARNILVPSYAYDESSCPTISTTATGLPDSHRCTGKLEPRSTKLRLTRSTPKLRERGCLGPDVRCMKIGNDHRVHEASQAEKTSEEAYARNTGSLIKRNIVSDVPFVIGRMFEPAEEAIDPQLKQAEGTDSPSSASNNSLPLARGSKCQDKIPPLIIGFSDSCSSALIGRTQHDAENAGYTPCANDAAPSASFLSPHRDNVGSHSPSWMSTFSSESREVWNANTLTPDSLFFRPPPPHLR